MNKEWLHNNLKPIIFYLVLFFFILAFCGLAQNYDYDLWARLIAGMGFVQTGHVLKQDFLSYTPTHIWYDHEWGSGVVFYLVQHFLSGAGIIFLQAVLVFFIFFFITKIVQLRGVKTTSAYNFLFYYFAFIAFSYVAEMPVRCQMFSFLFFTIFLYILEKSRKGSDKLLWALPFLMIIWNNLHGGCVSGIGLISLYLIGEFLNKRSGKKYFYVLAASIAVLPLNPWGVEYLGFLFKASTMQRAHVLEWFSPFSAVFMLKYMKFKMFAFIMIFTEIIAITREKMQKEFSFDTTKFLIVLVTLFLAIKHIKMIPFAVISMSCFIYNDFYTLFNAITKNSFNKIAEAKDLIIYCLILLFAFSNINARAFGPKINADAYPIYSIEFIKENHLSGNLLINFGQGSYAAYKLYPNNKIFMDGRYEEVYYDFMIPMLKKFYLLKPGWDEVLKKYPPDVMVVEKYYPVYFALQKNNNWALVFDKDKSFGVFVKKSAFKNKYTLPPDRLDYYKQTLFKTNICLKK